MLSGSVPQRRFFGGACRQVDQGRGVLSKSVPQRRFASLAACVGLIAASAISLSSPLFGRQPPPSALADSGQLARVSEPTLSTIPLALDGAASENHFPATADSSRARHSPHPANLPIRATSTGEPTSTGDATSAESADTPVSQHGPAGVVDVIEISGHLDGILADFIERSISKAEASEALALVLQMNSSQATITEERLQILASRIADSEIPVAMWVGPSGAVAYGAAGQLAGVVADLALAHGSRIGNLGTRSVHPRHMSDVFASAYPQLSKTAIADQEAVALGLARQAHTLPFFVLDLPGFRSDIDITGDEPTRVPVSRVRFSKLPLLDKFMHTAASPAVAYLLLLTGGVLLVLELYTAGVGIAGITGAAAFLLGCYGLAAQPVRVWAAVLLAVSAFGYCVDVQTGVPRIWTAIATVSLIAGSLTLFDGVSLGWITLSAGILSVVVAMVAGMPTVVRTRFATPTIGRDWLIGATGTTAEPVNPEGVVMIEGAPWRARAHRAKTIPHGERVRVTAIEGLELTVVPHKDPGDSSNRNLSAPST